MATIIHYSIFIIIADKMTSREILAKKSNAVRNVYFDLTDIGRGMDTFQDISWEESELYDSMERFHKLGHTR